MKNALNELTATLGENAATAAYNAFKPSMDLLETYQSVLSRYFQAGGKYAHLCKLGESIVDGLPRLVKLHEETVGSLAEARAERDKAVREAANRTGEVLQLRQRQIVPVKVRFRVTEGDIRRKWNSMTSYLPDDWPQWVMPYLAAHAVIDAPAGVPSVDRLAMIGSVAYANHKGSASGVELHHAAATAIRDAVLAGIAAERTATEPTAEQVEALARVLLEAFSYVKYPFSESPCQESWRNAARAAFAHIGAGPVGLPTRDQLKAAYRKYYESFGGMSGALCATDFALQYLVPYLRDPVGWELDVTAEEAYHVWHNGPNKDLTDVLDLCRSRIRPAFECKECAVIRAERDEINKNYMGLVDLFLPYLRAAQAEAAARAALEGE